MDIDLICNIICVAIPLLYLMVYIAKDAKKKKKKKGLFYGLVVCIIMGLLLFVIKLFAFTLMPINKENNNPNETTAKVTQQSNDPTTETTTVKTTTKASNPDSNKLDEPTGGTVLGKTSKGYEVKKENGIYYVDGYLVANKTYNLPKTYNPGALNAKVKKAADKMFADAKAEKGFNLYVASGFRSYDSQNSIYNNYVKRDGQKEADTYSARPGYSEHQTGLAFDVCDRNVGACITSGFDNTAQAKWLSDNAYKYGFILRYVKNKDKQTGYMYESWHFRYVGTELSEVLYNNGDWLTMEEYFGLTSSYDDKPIGE